MAKGHKHLKHLKSEKAKVKLKTKKNKLLPKGLNVTDTSFKVKKIVIREQFRQYNEAEIISKRKLNIKDLLTRLHHHNSTVRQEAVKELKDILLQHPSDMLNSQLQPLLKGISALSLDKEKNIRRDSFRVLNLILSPISTKRLTPFCDVLISYLNCAMTHIDPNIKEDSLLFLDILVQNCNSIIAKNSHKVLPNFLNMISRIHTEIKPGRQLTTTLNSKNTSVKWRIKVLERLGNMLGSVISYKKTQNYMPSEKLIYVDGKTKYIPLYTQVDVQDCQIDLQSIVSLENITDEKSRDTNELMKYISVLMPLMLDSWIEVCPEEKNGHTSETVITYEASILLKHIVVIIQLIIEYIDILNDEDTKMWFKNSFQSIYIKNLFSEFPYSRKNTVETLRKRQRDFSASEMIDKCLEQNLGICQIYAWFSSVNLSYNITDKLDKASCKYVMDYLNEIINGWSDINNFALTQLNKLLRTLFFKASQIWYINQMTMKPIFQAMINANSCQSKKELHVLLPNIIIDIMLEYTLTKLQSESILKDFLSISPLLLLHSSIHENMIQMINRAVLCHKEWMHDVLVKNQDAIIENAKKIQIIGSKDEKRSRLMILLMFTNMEQNSHCNNQDRLHSGLRHDTIIRGQSTATAATTINKINSQQSTKRLASVSEPGATNKRSEPKKSMISPKNDFLLQGFYKTKLVQVKQQRKQFEQQVLKSVIRPTNLIQSPIILNKNTDKVRRPTSTRTLLNFNHNNEEKNTDKPSILSKTTKNNYQTIASTDDISDSNEEAADSSEEIESENKSDESKTIEMKEISMENPNIDHNGSKATYFVVQRRVEEAIKNKKIFLIRGDIPYLENTLKKRGWIKKYESKKSRHLPYGSTAITDPPSIGNIHLADGSLNEDYVIFSVLKHISPDFIWDCRNDFVEWTGHIKPDTLLNRFEKSFIYTSKLGMATILENVHWYIEDDIASVQYPRSYNVARDKTAFTDDYRQTAAVSFLKWFIDQVEQGVNLTNKGSSPISPKQIEFAIKRCEEFIAMKNDEYLDTPEVLISSIEWDKFIDDYIMAVHHGNGIIDEELEQFDSERSSLIILYNLALETLKKVKEIDPQYELNGTRNIWILKPSNYCCGVGIAMAHKLSYIIKRVQDCARDYFIVQKYIEKPLLVRDTKFDVRQWYLVTSSYPLTIWIYNSRPFSFDSYHEAIHICNTAVQNKYIIPKNSARSLDWDCEKLNEYLKTIGYTGEPWYEKIYPKICQAIIATMLAAQEHMDKRKYSFELYGADFVIMNDLSVWLIEINTNPRMHPPGTRITQRLYPNVLESLIKVIMDYPFNPNADTGDFVLAYKQMITDVQPNTGLCLTALGKSILPKSKSLQHTNWQYL